MPPASVAIENARHRGYASVQWCWQFWTWLILACLVTNAEAQVGVGMIKELHGTANIQRNGHSIVAMPAMPILVGDKLTTSGQSNLTIELADGSQLIISEATAVVVDRTITSAADSRIDLFKGKLRSIVNAAAKLPGFEVHTPNAVASVRGTDFDTEYIEGKPCPGFPQCLRYTDIGVYKGIVEVRNPTSLKSISVRVTAGYETTVPCELPPANPAPLGIGDLTAPGYH